MVWYAVIGLQYHPSWQRVRRAVKDGTLRNLKAEFVLCVDCKKSRAVAYDHRDYAKPLEVDPVCLSCNGKRGRGLNRRLWLIQPLPRNTRNVSNVNPVFTTLTVSLRREQAERLRKKYPRYGEISKILRFLIQEVLEGRLKVKN